MSEPVYQDDYVTLYHGDMREELAWAAADVLVSDPPYGMSYQSNFALGGPSSQIAGDDTLELRDSMLNIWGAEKPALIFGTWRVERPAATRQLIVWHKGDTPGMGDLSLPWGPSHEEVYVLGGRGPEHWVGPRRPSVIRSRRSEGSGTADHNHPTPKPVALMQELISHTNPKYVIADPFAGSGSTLVAAKLLKRRAVGVELEREYIDATVRRLERIK